nr:zinc finger, CCHC-type [Tanacetum cinerariifolium]
MFDDDWGLESKEVSLLGEELSLFDRPNKVERGKIPKAHRLESILQQQVSQHMAPSHHDEDEGENPTVEQVRKRAKWDNDDYVCRGLILNGVSDSLFDIYQNVKTSKELWDTLEAKYMAEDASSKKFLVSNFTNYKMTNSRPVLEQYNKIHEILERFTQHKMNMDKSIQVSCVIDKLSPSWIDFKHTLKHLKEELTLIELGSHLRIEESLKVDSGVTVHVCKDRCWFKTYESLNDVSILYMGNESTALVHGRGCVDLRELEEKVYMNQPMGFIMSGNENKVLIKSVYSKFDASGKGVIICLYVDDMLIFGTDQVQMDLTKEFLSSRFSMKEMGETDVILGIRIKHESNGIAISQSHYIKKVLKKFNYSDSTPVSTPLDTCEKLMPNKGLAISEIEYSKVIGCLMYAMTCTKLDIAFVVEKLSRYTSNPRTQHWQAIQRVLKYLKKTMDYRLVYSGYLSVMEGYTDASWISNTEDNSSTSGWVFLLGGGAISWASKNQTCIIGSTMKSKFVALTAAGKEAEWLKNLLLEIPLWVKPIAPISIRCDSAATLAKAYSQMYNEKYKHLGVRHSMIRELIMNGVVSIEFVRSQQNLADHLTKGLARDLVIKSAEGMGLKSS